MLDSITKIVSGPIMQHKLNQRMGIEINISKKTNDLGQFKKFDRLIYHPTYTNNNQWFAHTRCAEYANSILSTIPQYGLLQGYHCTTCSCIVLYCIALRCAALHCTALHCIALRCVALHLIVLYCIVLYCIVLYCIVLYCIVLYCVVLYCIDFIL